MKKYVFVIGLIFIALMTGCCRKTAAPPSVSHSNIQDSIRETIVERIMYVHDSVKIEVPVEKIVNVLPDTDTSELETSMATSTAYIDTFGFLHHTLNNKQQTLTAPVDLAIPVSDTTHEEFHSSEKSDTVYVNVPAQLTGGQKFLMNTGWVTIIAVIALIGYTIFRLWRRK